jgi:hypothetical protein
MLRAHSVANDEMGDLGMLMVAAGGSKSAANPPSPTAEALGIATTGAACSRSTYSLRTSRQSTCQEGLEAGEAHQGAPACALGGQVPRVNPRPDHDSDGLMNG